MVICGLLLRGSQKISKNRLQLVYDALKLYLKTVQKLQIGKKKNNKKTPLNHWLAIKWKIHSILTSCCFLIFVRRKFFESTVAVCYTKPTTEPLATACGFEQYKKSVFIMLFNRFKWLCKGATCLSLSLQMKVKQKGLK